MRCLLILSFFALLSIAFSPQFAFADGNGGGSAVSRPRGRGWSKSTTKPGEVRSGIGSSLKMNTDGGVMYSSRGGGLAWILTQMLGMALALGIVVLLLYLFLRWLSSYVQPENFRPKGSLLRIRDRLSLEPKKGLWLIEISGRFFLIGTSDSGVHLLAELEREELELALVKADSGEGEKRSFLSVFNLKKGSSISGKFEKKSEKGEGTDFDTYE